MPENNHSAVSDRTKIQMEISRLHVQIYDLMQSHCYRTADLKIAEECVVHSFSTCIQSLKKDFIEPKSSLPLRTGNA